MGPERWQKIERIFHAVLTLPLEERGLWLERECGEDADLRAEVEGMLAVESDGVGFLETPAMEVAARALAAAEPLRPGSRFGPYEIGALLGEGGMGEVYLARDPRLNRTVAIKVLPAFGAGDPERRGRLLQEARAASALKHPNIVTIYDILSEGGRDALVMEHVAGRTLDEKLAGKSLPPAEALHYAIQIAGALATAHAAGIVHRDVKPGNIMVSGEEAGPGTVTVLDFGLAKFPETEGGPVGSLATGEGRIFGTVAYMSPEQAEGRRVDTRSDTFSFGLVLYEMLTGRKAFLRDTTTSTLAAILRDEFAPAPGIPERLRMVLARCLRKEPEKRAQSMADIRVLLEEIREELERPRAGSRGAFRNWKTWSAAVAVLVVLAAAGWLILARRGHTVEAVTVRPVTSYAGLATAPSFSPDGNQVAFSWDGEKQDNSDIYVKLVDSAAALRLTTNAAPDVLPAWSPDGRQIAFLRASGPKSRELLLVSPLGGAERKLAELSQGVNPAQWWTAPAWTPDSKFLAVRDESAIVLVSVESGEKRKLTSPPENWTGDWHAAFSPDGRTLAFARIRNGPMQDVYVAPVSDAAKVRQLTHDSIGIGGLAWTNDGKEIIFSSNRVGDSGLWRISVSGGVSGGAPEPVSAAGASASHPAIARQGQRAAFVRSTIRKSFWRQELGPEGARGAPVRLVASSRNDSNPMVSPDGRQIAFTSNRSGRPELWLCDSEGGNVVQLTSVGFARNAYWSPDGRNIAFDARPGERNLIFVIAAGGGVPRQLSSEEGYYPSWSRDGRWIYFYARMSGAIEAWRVPAAGGTAIQLTKRGGGPGIESMEGRYFYYHKGREIWKVPVEGGEETPAVREQTNFMNLWALGGEGLYFTEPGTAGRQMVLKLFRFERGESRQIASLDQPFPGLGGRLSLSADGRWLLYDQYDRNESDILLMEKFR